MKRRKLGRKKIKLRNNLILLIILIIFFSIYSTILNKKEDRNEQYAIQTQKLIQANSNIKNNTEGTTYYISATGTSTDGTDINKPMSLNTANKRTYNGNDKILFKAGDIFYGTINFNIQTEENEYVYIGSYGEGEKPIISGANILINSKAWTLEDSLYKIDLSEYSNFEGIGRTYWEPYNIGFIADENGNIYGNRKKTKDAITNEYDYYCEDNYLYIKCSKNPTEKLGKIKFVARNNLVSLSSNTILENLDIQYTGAHGIVNKNVDIKNVYVKNCIIQNIGGSVQIASSFTRYGNGLEFWNSASNTIVEGCIFRNIYDAGYTMQGNTVTTGFENNICQNNIFINCTYPYETFCRNKDDSSKEKDIYLKGQKFINNISINQGRGWGYNARPDKDPAAELVLWSMPSENTDIDMYGNKLFNSRRLKYTSAYVEIPVETFKKSVKSDKNNIYMSDDTLLMNNKGNYYERDVLQEYNIEQNSNFRLLTQRDLTKINNPAILTSNDYNEIKDYYENLEKKFPYEDTIALIQEKCTQLKQQNEDFKNKNSNIYKNTNISNAYNDLINGLDNIMQNPEQTNMDSVDEIYNKQFILIYQIVNEYNEKKIDINVNQYKVLINDLIDTSENYRKLYNLFYKNEDISTDDLTQKLNTVIERYNYNLDANLSDVTDLINKTKDIYNNSIDVDNSSDNYLNKLKVHKSCVIIANILENDIKTKADEESKNVKVKYNIKTPTNQNVTAEIRLPSDKCSIENNPNNEIYTFTENKTQEITIKIRGYKYGYYIQINNIDKIPPKITGVEDKGQYEGKVTPKVTDENLSETKLIKDEKVVEGYKANTSITQAGIYQLIARDKAGNETSVNFIILQKEEDKNKEEGNSKEEIKEEEKYKIEKNTVKNINGGTKLLRLKERLEISEEYKVKRNNKELGDIDKISTGDILETASGTKYTLIVKGDVNKDGDVNIEDIIKLERHLLGYAELGNVEKLAADTNLDNEEIGIVDLVRMMILALER